MAKKISKERIIKHPILPLRDIVIFPHMVVPLFIGREKSVRAIQSVVDTDKTILLVTQSNVSAESPTSDDLYTIGTLGTVIQLLTLPDGTVKALIEGKQRVEITHVEDGSFFEGTFRFIEEPPYDGEKLEPLKRTLLAEFEQYSKNGRKKTGDIFSSLGQIQDVSKMVDTICAHVPLKLPLKQKLLEAEDLVKRLELLLSYINTEIEIMDAEKRIRSRIKNQVEKNQREYLLNEQLKAIQRELGETDEGRDELGELEEKITKAGLSTEALEKAKGEMRKLKHMNPMSAEATVIRNYLDWLLGIPWQKASRTRKSLPQAEKILNNAHYGLDKVKERILEYLAVQTRMEKVRGSILCLVGPPGVGKTSLGKSIATATGRQFVRISLGGVRDESEIRGHRRTYIGSMPGKIIQGMRKAKTTNPLILLDEVDKLGADWRGDPASALLEVLDPEQNSEFNDHYLEVGYDLSKVLFVATANSLNMHPALLDRMEVIRIAGYTEKEKLEIARTHLLPRQMDLNGLKKEEFTLTDKGLELLIRQYCREAGVRNLERELANLARKSLKEIVTKKHTSVHLDETSLKTYAGVPRYRFAEDELEDLVGVTHGLAWTEAGGEIMSIEALLMPGKGKIMTTGKLGEVMQESIQAASSFVRSRAASYGIQPSVFENHMIHVHVPEGAIPKDGPSAGVAMCTSLVSVLTGVPVRGTVAMTGEISLRGRVLPIGGLKEKILAALSGGIQKVLIPEGNVKDLESIPDEVKNNIEIVPVSTIDQVLAHALVRTLEPIIWRPTGDLPLLPPSLASQDVVPGGLLGGSVPPPLLSPPLPSGVC